MTNQKDTARIIVSQSNYSSSKNSTNQTSRSETSGSGQSNNLATVHHQLHHQAPQYTRAYNNEDRHEMSRENGPFINNGTFRLFCGDGDRIREISLALGYTLIIILAITMTYKYINPEAAILVIALLLINVNRIYNEINKNHKSRSSTHKKKTWTNKRTDTSDYSTNTGGTNAIELRNIPFQELQAYVANIQSTASTGSIRRSSRLAGNPVIHCEVTRSRKPRGKANTETKYANI
eukprot:GHVP01036243.1.p1 GENE.GHVP01036243.1~~GHVP01036243.1.p1  ORF type:complete len:235 (-),score=13.04 GHVP01036243.1:957-1661(-)